MKLFRIFESIKIHSCLSFVFYSLVLIYCVLLMFAHSLFLGLSWQNQERKMGDGKDKNKKENKYREGTSDATTSSSLIVPLFTISVDDFSYSKRAIFGSRK